MRVNGLLGLVALGLLLAPGLAGENGKLDPAKLVGAWTYVSGEKDGKKIAAEGLKKGIVEITKETITLTSEGGKDEEKFLIKYKVDPAKTPARIHMEITEGPQGKGSKAEGIIAFQGKELQLCYPAMGGDAPTEFKTKEGSGFHLFTLKRKKKAE